MLIDLIAGTRPNFVKISALIRAFRDEPGKLNFRVIHTGQHYDKNLSDIFFKELELPKPAINLEIGNGSQAEQTAKIMVGYERELKKSKPDLCIVVGDVTSSMACAITAKKMKVAVAHVEAGIRSRDLDMPEEINRILIDSISDYFFTTTKDASQFLIKSGANKERVHFVGNTMIDTLFYFERKLEKPDIWKKIKLIPESYFVLTLHRPSNVDDIEQLINILNTIDNSTGGFSVIFPVHPRTKSILLENRKKWNNLHFTDPMGYLEFNYLVKNCKAVITDSGGVTEETTAFKIPCLTLRSNTERPETITIGTNELIGTNPANIKPAISLILENKWKSGRIPEKWDGKAGERIAKILSSLQAPLKP